MTKDIEWLKGRLRMRKLFKPQTEEEIGYNKAIDEFSEYVDQLDEPEVLSSDWIAGKKMWTRNKIPFHMDVDYAVPEEDLQNLLVPKQEVLSREWISEHIVRNENTGEEYVYVDELQGVLVPKQEITEEQVMEWLDNNDFYDHATAETVLENAVDKGELGYYGTKYSVVEEPVIPKFIAEVIEKDKEGGCDVYDSIYFNIETNGGGLPSISDWVAKNIDKYARAWLDGYEVEEEQKYQVIFRGDEYMRLYLCKHNDNVTIGTNDNYIEKCPEITYLTEQEIKDYDERYWPFAVKVEEMVHWHAK